MAEAINSNAFEHPFYLLDFKLLPSDKYCDPHGNSTQSTTSMSIQATASGSTMLVMGRDASTGVPMGAVVGGMVVGLVFFAVLCVTILLLWERRRNKYARLPDIHNDHQIHPFAHRPPTLDASPNPKEEPYGQVSAPESPSMEDVSDAGATILSRSTRGPHGSWILVESPQRVGFELRSASRLMQESMGQQASSYSAHSQSSAPSTTPPPRFSRLMAAGLLAAFGRARPAWAKGEPSPTSEPPPIYSENPGDLG
ncbi:hypothetical protein BD309DRAFT_196984 [Dichomitus squalens]|nr:hypothetical protein BD309DRAFT_196984 [Dichomitus squalens]